MRFEPRYSRSERIRYAIDATDLIAGYIAGIDEAGFLASRFHQDAVCMQLIHLADLLKPLDDDQGDLRQAIPEIGRVFGMRNIIVHQYLTINDRIVWNVAAQELPELRIKLQRLLDVNV